MFSAIVLLLQESGYVSLDVQYIDGTKVESASNRYTFVWRGSVEKNKVKLESKIQSILSEVDKHIEQDKQERLLTGYGFLWFAGKSERFKQTALRDEQC